MDNHVHFSTSIFTEPSVHPSWITAKHQAAQTVLFSYKYETSSERKDLQGKRKDLHKKVIQPSNQQADLQLRESRQDEKELRAAWEYNSSWIQTKEWKVKG